MLTILLALRAEPGAGVVNLLSRYLTSLVSEHAGIWHAFDERACSPIVIIAACMLVSPLAMSALFLLHSAYAERRTHCHVHHSRRYHEQIQ